VLARLVGIQRRLAAAEAPGRLLALLVDATRELTGARRGFVILRGAGGRRYEVVRAEGAAGPDDPFTELSRSVVEQVMDGGRSVVAESAFEDPRFRSNRSVSALGLRSILCIPIRVGGRTRGALYLDHPERPSLFRREDVHWLRAFADQAALILAERHQRRRIEALNSRLRRLLRRSTRELDRTRAALETATAAEVDRFQRMVGRSVALREVWRLVERIAPQAQPVLVLGETGTGKELVARALHSLGPRRGAPMVSVDCGALPEPLFESELFGHVRGGFTGAVDAAPGLFRAAHGGTLFLDEVGELALRPQAKLLRALESGEVRPVGGTATVRVDVRVIAATNRELEALVREGRFRADLFYRLNVLPIRLPPLRERPEDIPLLLSEFLSRTPGGPEKTFSKGALSRLLDYAWPGNVRELLNEVARLAAFPGSEVTAEMLSPTIRAAAGTGGATPEALRRASLHAERAVIEAALRQAGGNRSRAAKLLGVSRYGLYKKMLRCGIGS
jgi:transcriptional regulator with GAF, ATPase, and Fis domain